MADETIKDFYVMQVQCSNCGKGKMFDVDDYEIAIPKGTTVEDYLETHPCDYCGCTTLNKMMSYVPERPTKDKKEDLPDAKTSKDKEFVSVAEVLGKWESKPQVVQMDTDILGTKKEKKKYRRPRVVKVIR